MNKIIFLLFFFGSFSVFAQTVNTTQEVKTDDHADEDDINFRYDHNNFNMKMRMRVQGRATYSDFDTSNAAADKTGFEIRRARLSFDGAALDPHLFYKVQLAFTRSDFDWDTNAYPNILRDAVIGWKFDDDHVVFFGQTKLPGNRQTMTSSGKQELVDRSLASSSFNLDRDIGFQTWNKFGDSMPIWLKVAFSNGEGRSSENGDNGLATTARLEWLPLGSFAKDGDFFEGDLEYETSPKLSLGAAYSVNKRSHRVGGQTGKYIASGDSRDLEGFFADAIFKYRGWAFESEFAQRKADNPIIDASQFVLVGQAVNLQASYVFRNFYSPVVRWTKLWPEKEIYSRADPKTQYTVGLSKYISKHKIKVQSDLTYETVEKPLALASDQENWILRLQFEVGI